MGYPTDNPRDAVIRVLSDYYREVVPPEPESLFSVTALLKRKSLPSTHFLTAPCREVEVVNAHCTARGLDKDPFRPIIPWRALRALTDAPGSAGGYAVNGAGPHGELSAMLTPYSIVAEAGVTMLDVHGTGQVGMPVHQTAASGAWLGPGVTISPSTAPLGQFALVPKTRITLLDYDLQLDAQAGQLTDRLISTALMQSTGAAVDAAVITGAGGGVEPLGISGRTDIAATSGSSLAWSGICAMLKAVLSAGAREASLRWLAAPDVQEILAKREKPTGLGFIWQDQKIGGIPAIASSRVPSGYLVLADWSQLYVAMWNGGPRIEINPSAGFNTGVITARVVVMLDVGFAQAGTVTYAKSIT